MSQRSSESRNWNCGTLRIDRRTLLECGAFIASAGLVFGGPGEAATDAVMKTQVAQDIVSSQYVQEVVGLVRPLGDLLMRELGSSQVNPSKFDGVTQFGVPEGGLPPAQGPAQLPDTAQFLN